MVLGKQNQKKLEQALKCIEYAQGDLTMDTLPEWMTTDGLLEEAHIHLKSALMLVEEIRATQSKGLKK